MDRGAIKHIIGGANIMSPGLVNTYASMEEAFIGDIVSVYGYEK